MLFYGYVDNPVPVVVLSFCYPELFDGCINSDNRLVYLFVPRIWRWVREQGAMSAMESGVAGWSPVFSLVEWIRVVACLRLLNSDIF